jgi:hypothetical protein
MEIVSYLTSIYGYDTPIFLKDVRIGKKSKAAIKEEFYRAYKRGKIEKKSNGVYFIRSNNEFGSGITLRDVLESKYLYEPNCVDAHKDLFVCGYYSGLTFLNQIGMSQQVPAILEITTNRTSSKKRLISISNQYAIIRKSKVDIDALNYKILQFLDMFYFVSIEEVKENKQLLRNYIINNGLSRRDFSQYIGLYNDHILKKIVEGGLIDTFVE